jgi:glycosyltransferase involved in cell wall biosynthesis
VLRDDAGAAWLGQMLRRQAVRRHSWLDAAEQILDVYERLTR